jgi:hypothetical protein
MFKGPAGDRNFRTYLSVLSLVALILISLTTSKYGAGVSSDAARNLSTADNLLRGNGFVDMAGAQFVLWPPLYPLVIAGLSLLTNWSTFQSAWYLNVLLYVVNIWLSGWFLFLVFREKPQYAAAGALMMLLSRSNLRLYANVASEPLFIAFMLIFYLAAARYLQTVSRRALWLMFVMAGLAALQRYLGVILIGVGGLVVLTREGWRGLWRSSAAILCSIAPLGAWALLHNYPINGTLFGPRDLGAMLPLENIGLSLTKILWWFIPRLAFLDPLLLHPWIPLGAAALFLVLINKKPDWADWSRSLSNEYVWPGLAFSVVYFFALAFTVVTADHLDLTSDRYYVIFLPVVLILLFTTLDRLVFTHIRLENRRFAFGLSVLLALWFLYPVYSLQEYLRLALVQGEPTNYNIANSAQFRELSVVKAGEKILADDPSALVYSNYINVVWFIYGHPVKTLPFEDASLPRDERLAALRQKYPGWPAQSGYIIWFTPNQYHHIVAPDELETIADLKLLYLDKTGQIYFVQAHLP